MSEMKRDRFFLLFLPALLYMATLFSACGGGGDPAAEQSAGNGTGGGQSTSMPPSSEGTESMGTPSESVGSSAPVETGACNPEEATCPRNLDFTGQIGGAEAGQGGTPTFENYDFDAGISAVIAAMPENSDEIADGLDIRVEGAIVTAVVTFRDNTQFYVQDKNAAVMFFLDSPPVGEVVPVMVGQKISFTVNAIKNFFDTPEISQASNWQLISSNNPVYIAEKTGEDFSIGELGKIVRITGGIAADNGSCGGSSRCYTLRHEGGKTVTLRSASDFIEVGDCYTYVGPVSQFAGTPQLDSVDFDWINEDDCPFDPNAEETGGEMTEETEATPEESIATMETGGECEPQAECPENRDFDGQLGGNLTMENYAFDAGISAVIAAMPENSDEVADGLDLRVEGAVVTAVVAFRDDMQFYVQDKNAAVMLFLETPPGGGITPVTVGEKISFTVNAVKNFFGTPEITQASDWQLVSSGNPVYLQEKTGEEVSIGMLGQIVRITGGITEDNGPCGGSSICYTMVHGGQAITLRSASDFIEVGDCYTYVGPVSQFAGTPQLDSVDFDWIYENDCGFDPNAEGTGGETAQETAIETGGTTGGEGSGASSGTTSGMETGGTTGGEGSSASSGTTSGESGISSSGGSSGGTGETTGTTSGKCPPNQDFTGQIGAGDPPHGGTPAFTPYGNDAGISAVLAAAPANHDEENNGLVLPIHEATVTAVVSFREGQQFWIEDAGGAIVFFLPPEGVPDFGPPVVGQKISLTVNTVKNFFGTPEITQASDWQLVSSGNPVYIQEKTGEALSFGMLGQIVRVSGEITSNNGGCGGGNTCYTLTHGSETITLRTQSEFVAVGDCYTFVGPLGHFQETPQLDAIDFDWIEEN